MVGRKRLKPAEKTDNGTPAANLPTNLQSCIIRVNESKKKFKRRRKQQQKGKKYKSKAKKYFSKYTESDQDDSYSDDSEDEYKKLSRKSLKDIILDTIYDKKSNYSDNDVDHHANDENHKSDPELVDIEEENQHQPTGCIDAPQLKLDASGNIVIDEESLIIRSIAPDKLKSSSKAIDITNEVTYEAPLLYNTKRNKSSCRSKWSIEDTIRFYQVLSVVGADFQTMSTFFPGKTRDSVKKKFKFEEKMHLDLIDKALNKSLSTENEYLFQKIVDGEKDSNPE